ncbi:signal peptidase I [Bacillus spongiae]|uniref:Signal peptidase I n=1 Tax=Bacillus spongiae TaxID=2683610 RepID=A0ABU8HEH0_9BACI
MVFNYFKKIISASITTILFIVFITLIFVAVSSKLSGGEPQIFGYQIKTVLSGSMEPDIKTGSIIAVKPGGDLTRFHDGDIITFKKEQDMLVTHRIVEVVKQNDQVMYRTKGDNNKTEDLDLVPSNNIVAEYTGITVPYVGYLMSSINSKNGAFLLIIPGILLLLYSVVSIWRTLSQIDLTTKEEKPQKNNAL